MDRPRRRSSASTSTGPCGTWAAKVVCNVRSCWSGSSSSWAMARTASAVTMPPWGMGRRFQSSWMSAV